MIYHRDYDTLQIRALIQAGTISFAGNSSLKIFGRFSCSSGKRMKKENRVFFRDEHEAHKQGFRPCGHCMPYAYRKWKLLRA